MLLQTLSICLTIALTSFVSLKKGKYGSIEKFQLQTLTVALVCTLLNLMVVGKHALPMACQSTILWGEILLHWL